MHDGLDALLGDQTWDFGRLLRLGRLGRLAFHPAEVAAVHAIHRVHLELHPDVLEEQHLHLAQHVDAPDRQVGADDHVDLGHVREAGTTWARR